MGSFSILTTEKGTSAFTDAFTILTLIALIALTPPASGLTEPVNALTLSALFALVALTLVFTEAVTTLILNTLLHWPTLKHRRTDNDLYWLLIEFIHRIRRHLPYVICEWTENIHRMGAYQLNSLISSISLFKLISFQLYAVRRWRIYFFAIIIQLKSWLTY